MVVSVIGGPLRTGPAQGPAPDILSAAIAEGLVRFDAGGAIEPGLAERWIVRDDNQSFIFRLRDGTWPDGRRIVSDDVVPPLRRALRTQSTNALAPYLTAIDEIVAMTPQVIEVRLRRPRPDLLKLFAQPALTIPAPGRTIGGGGPFRIVQRTGDRVLLGPIADPDRTDDTPALAPEDHVRLRGERAAAAVLRFADKTSDLVLGGTLGDWPLVALAKIPPANVRLDPAAGLFGFAIVGRGDFLADPARRAALALAIDRTALTATLADGWSPTETILPEPLDSARPAAVAAWSTIPATDRAAAARALVLAWRQPVRLRIALPAGPGMTLLYGQVGSMLRRAGLDTVRVAIDAPADLRLVDAVAPYDSARWYLRTACQPCGADVAALIAASRDADSLAERARLLAAGDAALARDVAFIPIARPLRWSLVAGRLPAFTPNARAVHPLNHLRRDTK